jgi:hypothetical protein
VSGRVLLVTTIPVSRTSSYDAAASDRDVPIALLAAFWTYANLMRVVLPGSQRDAPRCFLPREHAVFLPTKNEQRLITSRKGRASRMPEVASDRPALIPTGTLMPPPGGRHWSVWAAIAPDEDA